MAATTVEVRWRRCSLVVASRPVTDRAPSSPAVLAAKVALWPPAGQGGDEVHGERGDRGSVRGEADREQPEPAVGQHRPDPPRGRGRRSGRRRPGGRQRAAHDQGVQRDGDQLDRGEPEQGAAPAVVVDQTAGQGQEDGAGEAGDHGDSEQGPGSAGWGVTGDDDGERGFVEAGC
jgi:hypothetical protein